MNDTDQRASLAAANGHSRVSRFSSSASVAVLCGAVLLVGGLFLTAAWLQHGSHLVPGHLPPGQTAPGQLPAVTASLAWLILPPIGILLAIPGVRPPRRRAALIALIGNVILWIALPATLVIVTLVSGP